MIMRKTLILLLAAFSAAAFSQEQGGDTASPRQMPQMQQMQGRMQAMQEQMARILETEDPAERQRLMQEHMQSMHQGMIMMGQMMHGGMPANSTSQCENDDTQCQVHRMQMQQQMMGRQMEMMQQMMMQMMEQMMQEQASENSGQ